jgi:hypothetical protein
MDCATPPLPNGLGEMSKADFAAISFLLGFKPTMLTFSSFTSAEWDCSECGGCSSRSIRRVMEDEEWVLRASKMHARGEPETEYSAHPSNRPTSKPPPKRNGS